MPRGKKVRKSDRPAAARQRALRPPEGAIRTQPGAPQANLLDLPEAVELLRTTRPTFYRWLRAGKLKGMKVGRQWRFERSEIYRFLAGQPPRIELPTDIQPFIATLLQRLKEAGAPAPRLEGLGPAEQAACLIVALGVAQHASDVHLTTHQEPGGASSVTVVRLRLDGALEEIARLDSRLMPALAAEFKRMAACDVNEKVRPQDGRVMATLAARGPGKSERSVDFRVNFTPSVLGEMVTLRILDRSKVRLDIESLSYAPPDGERLLRALSAAWGTILVVGPVGCGKTTVLYACLQHLAGPARKVVSIEDPVEFTLPWVSQVQLRPGLSYAALGRSLLRSDPDVIMIAELRDAETAWLAHQAALSGHLVLSTLHTNDAPSALTRLVEMGLHPFVVGDSLKLVVAQRLARKLCPHCSVAETPSRDRLDRAQELARRGGLDWTSLQPGFRQAVGCEKCSRTGYRGRVPIAEMLEASPESGKALREGATADELREAAIRQGMTTMAADGIRRAADGQTTLDEVTRALGAGVIHQAGAEKG